MGKDTNIEWAHHTFNPWMGCAKISPGCDNCYAEGWAKRSGLVEWGAKADRRRTLTSNWRKPLAWNDEAARLGIRYRVFCASLADVFDADVPPHWRRDLFDLIELTPHLDWLLVTKRIGNARQMIPDRWSVAMPPNIWLGITVVNQAEADRDIPKLLGLKVAVRFLSMEPLLSGVNLRLMAYEDAAERDAPGRLLTTRRRALDWVIVGGESGPGARPMRPQWARDIRDQCAAAGVPFLFKQWGEWAPASHGHGGKCGAWNGDAFLPGFGDLKAPDNNMTRAGKNACGGRLLDGQGHNGYPVQQRAEAGG